MGRKYYNRTNTCEVCGMQLITIEKPLREYDKKGRWTGRWLCNSCGKTRWAYGTSDKSLIEKIKEEYRKYNDKDICDICNINKLFPGNAFKEIANGEWTKKWICKSCYSQKYRLPYTEKIYNSTNSCDCGCGRKLTPGDSRKEYEEYDSSKKWTGRWLHKLCWGKNYQKFNKNSTHNIIKSLAKRRIGGLDHCSPQAKGYIYEDVTSKVRKVNNINKENDNYKSPIDHSVDPELGIIQTQGRQYSNKYKCWEFDCRKEHRHDIDFLICHCLDENGDNIEMTLIIPWEEVLRRQSIKIQRYGIRGPYWYEEYIVNKSNIMKHIKR